MLIQTKKIYIFFFGFIPLWNLDLIKQLCCRVAIFLLINGAQTFLLGDTRQNHEKKFFCRVKKISYTSKNFLRWEKN